jgi:murein tripeptide amidase MpaA
LIAETLASPRIASAVLGRALDGQDLDLLRVGDDGPGKRACWVIARQHPGETMAEWWMEGFLRCLLDETDEAARALLERSTFRVVPNMNPDGSRRGHLRTNAAGANLNREWQAPTSERSPEVALVRAEMERTGVDFCLDVHGDEVLPYVFLAGAEGIPSWSERLAGLDGDFRAALLSASPDYQTEQGYPRNGVGTANLTMCTNWVAERFNCLALTLEQPFKDPANSPDP